jgi:3-hydroxyacyl-CoA dehydrogenase
VKIKEVAVLGAGIMGRGIALVYALGGCRVRLYDSDSPARARARTLIAADLALLVEEQVCDPGRRDRALAQIGVVDDLDDALAEADFITEAIPENLQLKWQLFGRLEELCSQSVPIASNTSTLPLSDLARHMRHPERMIITHFFNPAHLVPLVEVVAAPSTPAPLLDAVLTFLQDSGKAPVVLKKEVPGFIANRLQAAVLREALHLVQNGVADLQDVDRAMTCGPGFRWSLIGPVETADYGGLDTWLSVMVNLAPELDDSPEAPEVLKELTGKGRLGVKSGHGFYTYPTPEAVAARIRKRDLAFVRLLKLREQL